MAGKVYLVGAGPGDPGLVTVKGLELIQKADCIVYDRLSAPELLSYAKEDCEFIYVGKADRHHTLLQEEINELLVTKAKEHACVVRLKGGDVYVFGLIFGITALNLVWFRASVRQSRGLPMQEFL